MVNKNHIERKADVAMDISTFSLNKFLLKVQRTTARCMTKLLGLVYYPIHSARITYASYRVQSIRDNLTDCNMYEQQIFAGNIDFVYVFIDKNYGAVEVVIMTYIVIINWNFIEEEVL